MTTNNWIETGRRHEAERNTVPSRLIRSQLPAEPIWQASGRFWYRVRWLSRIRDRQILRARLRAYVAW